MTSYRHPALAVEADLSNFSAKLAVIFWIAVLLAWGDGLATTCGLLFFAFLASSPFREKIRSRSSLGVFTFTALYLPILGMVVGWVVLLGLFGWTSLLLVLAFPELLWFVGPLMVVSGVMERVGQTLRPLRPNLLATVAAGIALAYLYRSFLPLAAAAFFATVWVISWRRFSRRDLWVHAARIWRSPSSALGSRAETETSRQAISRQLATVSQAARRAFLPSGGEGELGQLLASRAEGGWTGLTLLYFSVARDLHRAFTVEDTASFSVRYFDLWKNYLVSLEDAQLYPLLERLSRLEGPADLVKGDPDLFLCCDFLFHETAGRKDETRGEPAFFFFSLSEWIVCHLQGRSAASLEDLREILQKPASEALLPLCRRILGHAVQFQEGAFIRELIQNVLDEALRIGASPERRIVDISCRITEKEVLDLEIVDRLGMSFATVVNILLIPNRTTKSLCDWRTIGRFGQGFFTVLRDAEEVWIRTCLREPGGAPQELTVRMIPVWRDAVLHDVTVNLAVSAQGGGPRKEGTTVIWRSRVTGGAAAAARTRLAVRDQLQVVPVEELAIRLEGELINLECDNFARIPTSLGPLSLSAGPVEAEDLLVTRNNLPLARVSRYAFHSFLPSAPEHFVQILFTGGVVLDLPPGLPLNRTRTALAARERFAEGLACETVRACLLADVEAYLRLKPRPSTMARDEAIPVGYYRDSSSGKRRRAWSPGGNPFSSRSRRGKIESLAKRIGEGEPFLEELDSWWMRGSDLLVSLPCIRHYFRPKRSSVEDLARSSFFELLLHDLPYPSWPVLERMIRKEGLGPTGTLVRWITFGSFGLIVLMYLVVILLFLSLPFRFLGQQAGWIALFVFMVAAVIWGVAGLIAKSRLAVAVSMEESDGSVWGAFGSIGERLAQMLIGRTPSCRLYRRNTQVAAFARGRWGIFWNAWHMKGSWDMRCLKRFLEAGGGLEAAGDLEPWLQDFLLVLTHEAEHLREESGCTTHDEIFFQRQRRLLEKVLQHEESAMELLEQVAQRRTKWTWSPAWAFIARRMMKRNAWELLSRR